MTPQLVRQISRVLVVEDDRATRDIIGAMLRLESIPFTALENGSQVINLLQKGDYDFIIMDIFMPGIDGLTVTRHIRALPEPICRIPILGITVNAETLHFRQGLEAGMTDILDKPFTISQLFQAIAECFPGQVASRRG